jgi:hypothetical protein
LRIRNLIDPQLIPKLAQLPVSENIYNKKIFEKPAEIFKKNSKNKYISLRKKYKDVKPISEEMYKRFGYKTRLENFEGEQGNEVGYFKAYPLNSNLDQVNSSQKFSKTGQAFFKYTKSEKNKNSLDNAIIPKGNETRIHHFYEKAENGLINYNHNGELVILPNINKPSKQNDFAGIQEENQSDIISRESGFIIGEDNIMRPDMTSLSKIKDQKRDFNTKELNNPIIISELNYIKFSRKVGEIQKQKQQMGHEDQ